MPNTILFRCAAKTTVPRRTLLLGAAAWLLGGVSRPLATWADETDGETLQRFEFEQRQMGVAFKIVLYCGSPEAANQAADAAFARIAAINARLSDYDAESELSRLSAASPTDGFVPVSDDLWQVLGAAQKLSVETEGAFDVTVGPYTRLWRRARRRREVPTPEQRAAAARSVGYSHVLLHERDQAVRLAVADMRLDLGGIAKGFAADEALRTLRRHGVSRAFVDGSGDVTLGDPPPGETGWRVGVAPLAAEEPPSIRLLLANCAVATSGDAFQYVELDGVRYSHLIDPHTGLGLTRPSAVTVVAPTGMAADSLASAVSVLGPQRGLALAEKLPQVEALFVALSKDGAPQIHRTPGFAKLPQTPAISR